MGGEELVVQDAFSDLRDQLLADPDDMPPSQEEEAKMAMRYTAAFGEVAEELIPALRDYLLLLPDSSSLVGATVRTDELVRIARGLGLAVRASHSDLVAGWSSCESLVPLGRFAAEALPLGEANVISNLITMALANEFAHIALEALSQPGMEWSDEVIHELRALLALLSQRSGESLPRTAYEQVQSAEWVFDEFVGPGAAWLQRGFSQPGNQAVAEGGWSCRAAADSWGSSAGFF